MPFSNEWIMKMRLMYTMEYYSAGKKNEIMIFSDKFKEQKNIILSEVTQIQKRKYYMSSLVCGS